VFFQIRESANSYCDACPAKVQAAMDKLAEIVGRSYHLFDDVGSPREQEFHQDHRRQHRQLRTLASTIHFSGGGQLRPRQNGAS
jgi:hypothetical protein